MAHGMPQAKRCGMCQQNLPLEAFSVRRASPDGRMARCRSCDSAYKKAHRAVHPERHQEYERRRYTGARRERVMAASRARYLADPEKWNAEQRARAVDPEAARAKQRAYKAAHPDRVRAWKQADYQRNGHKARARQKAQYDQDPAKFTPPPSIWRSGYAPAPTPCPRLADHRWTPDRPEPAAVRQRALVTRGSRTPMPSTAAAWHGLPSWMPRWPPTARRAPDPGVPADSQSDPPSSPPSRLARHPPTTPHPDSRTGQSARRTMDSKRHQPPRGSDRPGKADTRQTGTTGPLRLPAL